MDVYDHETPPFVLTAFAPDADAATKLPDPKARPFHDPVVIETVDHDNPRSVLRAATVPELDSARSTPDPYVMQLQEGDAGMGESCQDAP